MPYSRIHKIGRGHSLIFYCEDLPAEEAALAAGRNPNGYFWEGVATFGFPNLVKRVELDAEAGMFSAVCTEEDLRRLQDKIEPSLADPTKLAELLTRADEAGFEFED